MSSFFTLPASQKKRKRAEAPGVNHKRSRKTDGAEKSASRKTQRDDSISGSDSEAEGAADAIDDPELSSSGSEEEDETGAARRLRLAERYLDNVKDEVQDQIGFNAEDIDRDLIAERLKEDVAETKGKLHRFIASDYDYTTASKATFRHDNDCSNGIATCAPYAYTVSRNITLIKWELPTPPPRPPPSKPPQKGQKGQKAPKPTRRRPIKIASVRGKRNGDRTYQGHTGPILCVAASEDGKFVVTGGEDGRLVVWSAADLTPLKVFHQHRDAVTSLAFRRGTNQLYSSSSDRTIKTWSLNELAYVETLFGHQDKVVDVAALSQERCLSAGARDRTARLWKVVEETQLVFRGGSGEKKRKGRKDAMVEEPLAEGCIDRVAFVDDETFITGSDNGSLCLWSVHKKKPVYTVSVAHGKDPALQPEEAFAEMELEGRKVPASPEARWITALKVLPYSDLVVSGSWDGDVRVWKVSSDRKKIERVAAVGRVESTDVVLSGEVDETPLDQPAVGEQHQQMCRGVINDLEIFERGDKGKDGLCIVVALGKHHRMGRWRMLEEGQNGAVMFEIPRK